MGNFFSLISIENTKLWKRLSTKVMIIIMVLIVVAGVGLTKYLDSVQKQYNKDKTSQSTVNADWKTQEQASLKMSQQQLDAAEKSTSRVEKVNIGILKKQIAESEYRIDHDIKPEETKNIWSNVISMDTNMGFATFLALLLIIACAALTAGEFSEGTMKTMISRPYSRNQILSAKFVAVLIYGLELLGVTFVSSFIVAGIFYGFNGIGAYSLMWTGSKIVYIPAVLNALVIFALDFLTVIVYTTLAFALSVIFRSRSIATGFSLFLLLIGGSLTRLLGIFVDWGKFILFNVSNFSTYITEGSVFTGTSLPFALIVSAIYCIIFMFCGYFIFAKRDI